MNTRTLGKTGYNVSEIGLGCWQFGGDFGPVSEETSTEILKTARSLDVNFWDTADVYGGGESESRIGRYKDKKGILVATKLGRNGTMFPNKFTRKNMKESLAGSLKRLGVETLDLAQLHTIPTHVLADGEVFNVMDDLRDEGMMRHWGASVENVEEAVQALQTIETFDRATCRRVFEARFSSKRMAEDYVEIYERLIHDHATNQLASGKNGMADPEKLAIRNGANCRALNGGIPVR